MYRTPHPDPAALIVRLRQRGYIISHTDPACLQPFLDAATDMGRLLRIAREFLEETPSGISIDPTTQWLWEQGLALPEEVAQGQVRTVLRLYADAAFRHTNASVAELLVADMRVLHSALRATCAFPADSV